MKKYKEWKEALDLMSGPPAAKRLEERVAELEDRVSELEYQAKQQEIKFKVA
jgi:hypothetical protein